jgi:hypothetical protein
MRAMGVATREMPANFPLNFPKVYCLKNQTMAAETATSFMICFISGLRRDTGSASIATYRA